MNAVTSIAPHLRNLHCPAPLRDLQAWVCWRFEHHEGEAKPRKVPVYCDGGRRHGVQGSPNDRERLTTFAAALQAAMRRGMDGVGFCPMPEWGVTALDFDNCVVDGRVDPQVLSLVHGTYAELSPSGKGVRAFVRGALGNRKHHGEPFGFETFHSKGFVTLTGSPLPVTELTDCTDHLADASPAVLAYCEARFGAPQDAPAPSDTAPLGLTPEQITECLDVLDPSMDRAGWLAIGMALHHETRGTDEGLALWDEWSSGAADKYPGPEDMRYRWEGFGRGGQRPTTAHRLVRMANEAGARIDLAALESAGDFQPVAASVDEGKPVAPKPMRFPVISAEEFMARPPMEWIVKGLLPRAEVAMLYGDWGTGKSFIAVDLFAAIDRGVEWFGMKTKKARVMYVVAEGARGFRNRLVAYRTHHGVSPGFGLIDAAPNLTLKEDALDVARAIVAAGGADVVVIDTLAQTTAGANENSAEDMGLALTHCKGISRALGGAMVVLVHHTGKDSGKGARGWSGLSGACDSMIEVVRTPTGRMLQVPKEKDGPDSGQWGFDLEVVNIGTDEDGDPITSCVVTRAELPAVQQIGEIARRAGPVTKAVIAVMNEMAQAQTTGIELKAVIEAAAALLPAPEDRKRDTRKQRCRRAILELCDGDEAPYFLEGDCLSIV